MVRRKLLRFSAILNYLFRGHKTSMGSRQGSGANQNDRDDRYFYLHLNWRMIEVPAVSIVI
jgi:hypothetical protein